MKPSKLFAHLVAFVGAGAIFLRHRNDGPMPQAFGAKPNIPTAKPQGIPTLKMPTAKGWANGQTPVAAAGLKVNAFATGLKHPRWIQVMSNGDVLTAEALFVALDAPIWIRRTRRSIARRAPGAAKWARPAPAR